MEDISLVDFFLSTCRARALLFLHYYCAHSAPPDSSSFVSVTASQDASCVACEPSISTRSSRAIRPDPQSFLHSPITRHGLWPLQRSIARQSHNREGGKDSRDTPLQSLHHDRSMATLRVLLEAVRVRVWHHPHKQKYERLRGGPLGPGSFTMSNLLLPAYTTNA